MALSRRVDGVATVNPMWYPHVFPVRGIEVFAIAGKFQYFENYAGADSIRTEQPLAGSNESGLQNRGNSHEHGQFGLILDADFP